MKRIHWFVLFVLFTVRLSATHAYGGEITWKCFSSGPNAGKFKFYMTLYRDCGTGNATLPGSTVVLNSNSPAASITLTQVGVNADVSPTCYLSPSPIRCNVSASGQGALEEAKYESSFITLNGTPPPSGWQFTYSLCCRPNTISNLANPGSTSLFLRATMYPYLVNGTAQNASNCYDSSPKFLESPKAAFCTGSKQTYGTFSFDENGDSLSFNWADVLNSSGSSVSYSPGYSSGSPLPSGNVPAFLNSVTGDVTFNPNAGGAFATAVAVKSFRCGQLISEVVREIPIVVRTNCPNLTNGTSNKAPSIQIVNYPGFPQVLPVLNGLDTSHFEVSVFAGQEVKFNVSAQDPQLLPTFLPQSITMQAIGGQMGNPFGSASSGCLTPPCATVLPIAPQISYVSSQNNDVAFSWQTQCDHVAGSGNSTCSNNKTTYQFALRMQDNFCPIPGVGHKSIIVNVLDPSISPPLLSNSVATQNPSGQVVIPWAAPIDTGLNFEAYIIYHGTNTAGPFSVLDSVSNYSQLSYVHSGPMPGENYYFLRSLGQCGVMSICSDTIDFCLSGITSHPADVSAYTNSLNAAFKCVPVDSSALFQWQEYDGLNWINLNNSATYMGAASDSLTIVKPIRSMNGNVYRCIVSGCTLDTSETAQLFVNCADTLMTMPQNFVAFTNPGWAKFTFKHSDTTAQFQWQEYNGSTWSNITSVPNYVGSNSDSLTITGVTQGMHNFAYRCVSVGCTTDTSSAAILTVTNGVGLTESARSDFFVQPNPTSGKVLFSSEVDGIFEIWTLDGKLIKHGIAKSECDFSELNTGIYLLRIITSQGIQELKVFRE